MFFFINDTMENNMQRGSKIKVSSNKSFGLVFFIVFLIIAIWPLMYADPIRIWSVVVSLVFLILGLLDSKLLIPLNLLWFKFGNMLGAVIAPIAMAVVFFLVITPIGFIMKIVRIDSLNKKYDKKRKTYWIKRNLPINTMKRQF